MPADPPPARVQTRAGRRALLAQLSAPARRFLSTEAGSAGLLLAATVVALAWANSPWSDAYLSFWAVEAGVSVAGWELSTDLGHWVNDGLMALFFFVIGLEVRRELSVGELTDLRRTAVPVAAALGGLAVPALLFLALAPGGDAARGWGVVIGTDTAFMLGALAVVGPTFATQLRVFLLTLTVIDDIVAVSVIGVFYTESLDVAALVAMAALGTLLAVFSRLGVWRAAPYAAVGLALWVAAVQAGLHASIAGMLGGLLVAAHPPARDLVEGAAVRFRRSASLPTSWSAGPRAWAWSAPCRSTSGSRPPCTPGPATSWCPCSPWPTPGSTCATACSSRRSRPASRGRWWSRSSSASFSVWA
ncbi:Na+/H+ antiporter 1 [Georgenia muralis]|uniref:Na+/H+ antiporter 1 n=1 Tax=Georgenia muralis TaxID=154117 RepID=A0A3N5A4P1_9MICO|nr:Na+/H+ antiporter 1 [Georgenia muralis]